MTENSTVLIVGAGPVGLFLAYLLGKAGIDVLIIEKLDRLSDAPRAGGYYAAAVIALQEAGLIDALFQHGANVATAAGWRAPVKMASDGSYVFGDLLAHLPFDHASEEHPERGMLLLPQSEFCKAVYEKTVATGHVKLSFSTELCGIHQDDKSVTATVRDVHTGVEKYLTASFLVGADGGKSLTRKALNITFQGHTWPERLIATDVVITHHELPRVQVHQVVDPINFAVIVPMARAEAGKPSMWRYTIAVDRADDLKPDEEILSQEYIEKLYEKLMAGPRPLEYKIQRKAVYRIHQRLATTLANGRCVLAGDAAHLNNPFGAMGLASGILDADALAQTLLLILQEQQPLSLLMTYSDERRQVFQTFVDPASAYNKLRLQTTVEMAENDWFFKLFKEPKQSVLMRFLDPFINTWRTNMRQVLEQQQEMATQK